MCKSVTGCLMNKPNSKLYAYSFNMINYENYLEDSYHKFYYVLNS